VTFTKHFAKTSYELKAPFTQEQLTDFIDGHYYSLQYLHKKTLKRIMTIEPATLLYVHTDPSSIEKVNFNLVSEQLKSQILCISTPVTLDKHMKRLLRFLGLIGPHIKYRNIESEPKVEPRRGEDRVSPEEELKHFNPLVGGKLYILERNEDKVLKYLWDGKSSSKTSLMSVEDVHNFYNDWIGGILKPFYKSMPVSSIPTNTNSLVKTLVGENFEDTVFNPMKDVVVFYHSIWCLDCPDLLAVYEKLAEAFSKY
jgi:thiol-disulfide isomerase/thioredoxin